ncbi:cell envelope integrity protein TolA [Chlorobaculum sp. 24CR]|uniref:energy transducer TonB n=1 Tax=Chlorobaculum sp. 24CR TaxID=2508878 RepID=UPI00100B1373|nr:TonB C-terminal domain-containing protein [Chlorobaculum sp. 24CR]RXK82158.1 cell envelope integrity protein TolA [Chlorobaculum sp. 24CR]
MQSRDELKQEERRFYVWIGIAAAAHVAVVVAVVVFQLLYVRMHPPLKIVNVSLVQMPGLPGPAGGPKIPEAPPADVEGEPEQSEPVAVKKVSEPAPKAEKKVPEPAVAKKIPEKPPAKAPVKAPEPAPKKPSAVDERKNLQAALEKLKSKSSAEKPETGKSSAASNLSSTLANLQKKVASGGSGSAYSGSGSGAGGGRYGSGGGGAFDPYAAKIAGIIQNNWSFSSQMVRSAAGLEVYVSLLILPDGSVSEIRYDRKSSSEYLNNSVRVALAKSTPFPALPRDRATKGIWIGFVFTPEGIKP